MNMLNRLTYLFILFALVLTSCSKSDEDDQQPTPDVQPAKGATLQVMVAFAPGQLGDQGFADNVMKSVVLMQQQQKHAEVDSINIEFIALYSFGDTRQRLRAWAAEPANPYYNHDYERRLLVLTEPYMAQWLGDINTLLRPTDEVLLLRATEAEVQEAATTYALDQRLHALNIDIGPFIRMYANFMKKDLEMWRRIYEANHEEDEEEDDDDWYDDWDDDDDTYDVPVPDHVRVYVYRQYEPTVVKYSDNMEELLRQELGPEAEIIKLYVDNLLDDGHYNEGANNNYLETVYQTTYQIGQQCYEEGLSYIIFDLGIWNTSAIRYMNINEHSLDALMIDATTDYSPGFSCFMKRDYSRALQEWVNDWCQQPAVTMPQIRTLGDDYITHDIPKVNHDFE